MKPKHQSATGLLERRSHAHPPRPQLLICDDEPRICELMRQALATLGGCDIALNGEEALTKLNSDHYDLLLLDLHMPKMDGLRVLEVLRQMHRAQRVIVLTAYQDLDIAHEAHRLYGLLGYLTKPIAMDTLHTTIRQALAQEPLPV